MNIKCPNCQTAYVVPDEKVGEKPKKMRCSRCQEIFTVKRRSQKTPIGYQEFTGRNQALPSEFSFLRPSLMPEADAPVSVSEIPVAVDTAVVPTGTSPDTKVGAAPPPVPPKKVPMAKVASGFEDFSQSQGFEEPKTNPGIAPSMMLQPAAPASAPKPPASPAPAQSPTAPTTATTSAQRPVSSPRPVLPTQDLYGGNTWETEVPLDLGNYAIPSAKSQRVGKIVAIIVGVVLLFFIFVMARNGWSLSPGELSDQIAFAFSGGEYEDLPVAVRDLEVTVNERRVLNRSSGGDLVIVVGTVFNNSPVERKSVQLRGRLRDANGDVKGEIRVPCDKIFEDAALKQTPVGQVPSLYRKAGTLADCSIRGESSTVFQMVFENIPPDYDPSFVLEVIPVFAE